MEALWLGDGTIGLDLDRCIGCGLCTSTCPTGSLTLMRKPEWEQREVPKDMIQTSFKLGRARGKLGGGSLVKMMLKSKIDRLLAPK